MAHDLQDNNMSHAASEPLATVALQAVSFDTLADLPPADTKRWVVRRKEQVVQAVQAGRLTREQACEHYRLSEEEYQSWEDHLVQHGLRGLRVTRLQDYRRQEEIAATATTRRRA